jgi:hypothetical protein
VGSKYTKRYSEEYKRDAIALVRCSLTRADNKARPAPDLIGRDFHADAPGTKLVGDITYLPTARAGSTSPAGWTWPPARSSVTRWPTITALPSSWTPWRWPTAGRNSAQDASYTVIAAARVDSSGRRNTF